MQFDWIYEPSVQFQELYLFQNALQFHKSSYNYYPISVAKRQEYNMKYRFLCIAKDKSSPYIPASFALIEIYQPEFGAPYATLLRHIPFDTFPFY